MIDENPLSWHNNNSLLFIDSPVGTGKIKYLTKLNICIANYFLFTKINSNSETTRDVGIRGLYLLKNKSALPTIFQFTKTLYNKLPKRLDIQRNLANTILVDIAV